MRALLLLLTVSFSATAFAQSPPPKGGKKPPLAQAGQKGCKLVGTVKGTKLWAGDCTDAAELRGAASTETQSLPERATGAIPPGEKQ